jgi:DNA polymerase-3 subunit epsilon
VPWYNTFVAIDTETTGFGPTARILEIAAVTFENGQAVHSWSSLVCPPNVDWDNPKVQEALQVNHLTRETLHGAPTFDQVVPDLLLELAGGDVAAHNLSFDLQMVNQELTAAAHAPLRPSMHLCTMTLSNFMSQGKLPNKLADVAARFNVSQPGAHRAVVDATVCGGILAAMAYEGRVPKSDDLMARLCDEALLAWKNKRRW